MGSIRLEQTKNSKIIATTGRTKDSFAMAIPLWEAPGGNKASVL